MPKSFGRWMGESVFGDSGKLQRELSSQLGVEMADSLETAIAKLEADKEEERDRKLRDAATKKAE